MRSVILDTKHFEDCDDGCPFLTWNKYKDACGRIFDKGAYCQKSNRDISSGFSCGGIPAWCELENDSTTEKE